MKRSHVRAISWLRNHGGGGTKTAPAKGSTTIKKSLFIWALPVWVGGSKPLPGWFVAPIFRRNDHVQTGICMILPENRCHRVPV